MKKNSLILLFLILFLNCKNKNQIEDIEECDSISNLYEGGNHYIKRDLVTDEGVIDYNKLLEQYKQKNSKCYPVRSD